MDSLELFRRRRAATPPSDSISGLVFDGVRALLEKRVGVDVARSIAQSAGVPKRLSWFLKYPAPAFMAMTEPLLERMVADGVALNEAMEAVGDAGTSAFLESAVGQMMRKMAGDRVHAMGTLAPTAYGSVYSYGTRRYERTGERTAVLRFTGDWMGPGIQAGVVKTGLGKTCSVAMQVSARDLREDGTTFSLDLSW